MAKRKRDVGALYRHTAAEAVALANGTDDASLPEPTRKIRAIGNTRGPLPREERFEAALYRVKPEQAEALRRIAGERVAPLLRRGAKGARPDVSALVREALAEWLAKHDK